MGDGERSLPDMVDNILLYLSSGIGWFWGVDLLRHARNHEAVNIKQEWLYSGYQADTVDSQTERTEIASI